MGCPVSAGFLGPRQRDVLAGEDHPLGWGEMVEDETAGGGAQLVNHAVLGGDRERARIERWAKARWSERESCGQHKKGIGPHR
jgi:hypothetical protein